MHRYTTLKLVAKNKFHLPYFPKLLTQQSIKFKGAKLWNAIPAAIKDLQSKSSFSIKLK